MLKAKKGFLLRKLGPEYMVVAIGEARQKLQRHDPHERDRRFLLERAGQGATEDSLVAKTMERFTNVNEETARHAALDCRRGAGP